MKAADLMAKALQAATSTRVLLETGDADGACNRACYAMRAEFMSDDGRRSRKAQP